MTHKISLKIESAEGMPKQKVKGVDTGHIRSLIPVFIRFLHMLGYDTVADVHIVMAQSVDHLPAVWGKEGRLANIERTLLGE